MKIGDAWGVYFDHSGRASDVMRKLAFSGIALVWIFSGGNLGNASRVRIRGKLTLPLALMVLALAMDFLQYVYLAMAARRFAGSKESELQKEHPAGWEREEFEYPKWIARRAERLFFFPKLVVVSVGYVWLLIRLWQQVM